MEEEFKTLAQEDTKQEDAKATGELPPKTSVEGLALALCNLVLTGCFGFFAYAQTLAVIRELKLSSLLLLAKELLDVGFYLSKRRAWRISFSLWGWLLAFAGTAWPLLYRPAEGFRCSVG